MNYAEVLAEYKRIRSVAVELNNTLLKLVPKKDIEKAAERDGIAPRTLDRAKSSSEVKAQREGFGPGGRWVWSLPQGSADLP